MEEARYRIDLSFSSPEEAPSIREEFSQKLRIHPSTSGDAPRFVRVRLSRDEARRVQIEVEPPLEELGLPFRLQALKEVPEGELLLRMPPLIWVTGFSWLDHLGIYDIDPKQPKTSAPLTGKVELEEDGRNLALAVKALLSGGSEAKRARFLALARGLLPFVWDIRVDRLADRSLLLRLEEVYNRGRGIPASSVSDGTLAVLALLLPLYIEERPVVIIEEPERNLHPSLLAQMAEMMKDAATRRQVIVTTQSAELIKHVGLDALCLLRRNQEGFSEVTRPAEKDDVKVFLTEDFGIDDLYIANLL